MPRPTAPAALRLLNGRSEGRDSGGREVKPAPSFRRIAPNPPTWLPREAKAEWRRVAPGLTRLDLLKEEDRAALAAYCVTWAKLADAARDPDSRQFVALSRELRSWAAQFGLTPAAESNVASRSDDGAGDPDPFG